MNIRFSRVKSFEFRNRVEVYDKDRYVGKITRAKGVVKDKRWWISGEIALVCRVSVHKKLKDAKLEITFGASQISNGEK